LTVEERKDPDEGGLDARKVVERIDKSLAEKEEKQVKHRLGVKMQMKEAKDRRVRSKNRVPRLKDMLLTPKMIPLSQMAEKKERKSKKKAEKLEKTAKYLATKNDPNIAPEIKAQITPDGGNVQDKKKEKAERQKKLNKVLPPKAERKARKKEEKEIKWAAKKEAAKVKAKEAAVQKKVTQEAGEAQ